MKYRCNHIKKNHKYKENSLNTTKDLSETMNVIFRKYEPVKNLNSLKFC